MCCGVCYELDVCGMRCLSMYMYQSPRGVGSDSHWWQTEPYIFYHAWVRSVMICPWLLDVTDGGIDCSCTCHHVFTSY